MAFSDADHHWMQAALDQARLAAQRGEVPVGAVIVDAAGACVGAGFNQPISSHDATAHAEIVAIRAACQQLQNYRLPATTLFVTLEPCTLCVGAIVHARIERLVYAACEPKSGVCESHLQLLDAPFYNHHPQVEGGLLATSSSALLKTFFAERRAAKRAVSRERPSD